MADDDKKAPSESATALAEALSRADEKGGIGPNRGDGKVNSQEINEYYDQLSLEEKVAELRLIDALNNPELSDKERGAFVRELGKARQDRLEMADAGRFFSDYVNAAGNRIEGKKRFDEGLEVDQALEMLSEAADLSYRRPEAVAEIVVEGGKVGIIAGTVDGKKVDGSELIPKLDADKSGGVDVAEYIKGDGDKVISERRDEINKEEMKKAAEQVEEKLKDLLESSDPTKKASTEAVPASHMFANVSPEPGSVEKV